MAHIRLENVSKSFGSIQAVADLSVQVNDGEFFTLLGPPGAGKTTTLRLITGLETLDTGRVYLDDQDVTGVYPGARDIAMIFQNLALYPDKTARENMAYPLRERKLPKAEIASKIAEAARVLHIDHLLDRKPGQLSGGERQRVAIGRAIVRRPRAYLMDEPLSALDALLRLEMRVELKRLQRDLGQTLVYVTHDQIEAMSMSDRIAVLHRGVLQQVDTPANIYNAPVNRFVAMTVGSPPINFIPCHLEGRTLVHPMFRLTMTEEVLVSDSLQVELGVRPEHVQIALTPDSARISARIEVIEPLGAESVVDLRMGETMLKALVESPFPAQVGETVYLRFDADQAMVMDTLTDCFAAYGRSGAPLWEQGVTVGLSAGE
jgi:ABC-type sugar transport system ATPase subunit